MSTLCYEKIPEVTNTLRKNGSDVNSTQDLQSKQDLLIQEAIKDRENRVLFMLVKNESVLKLEDYLNKHYKDWRARFSTVEQYICDHRDLIGANIIHYSYLTRKYDIARWLVHNFPRIATLPYSASDESPFEGENILHIVIAHKNYEETKWLLDFYRERNLHQLKDLLFGKTKGNFFTDRNGSFYCGCFPIHFAACSNDTHLFDLILAYSSSIDSVSDSEPNGLDYVFMRDQDGNNCLHLTVIHQLPKMYAHIKSVIKEWLFVDLERNVYQERPAKNDFIWISSAWQNGFGQGYTVKDDHKITSTTSARRAQADRILCYRMTMVLNDDGLSPLTLCAAGLYSVSDDNADKSTSREQKQKSMLQFLINQLKSDHVQWIYGSHFI